MAKRMILMLAGMGVLIVTLGFLKFRQFQAAAAQAASFQPPPEAVTTVVASREAWPVSLEAIGTATAVQGVTVSADLPGVVVGIAFESGRTVREGAPLVQLDTRQEQAQLTAAEAQRELARLNLERMRDLHRQGIVSQADFDRLTAEHAQAEARVGEIRATIRRKQVRAPFTGILGIRQVNLGQYLNAGDPIVSVQSLRPIHVNFAVPQQDVGQVRVGSQLEVAAEGESGGEFTGRITAVDSVVDEATRNVQVQATLDNRDGRLRPGMFVETRVVVGDDRPVVSLPASAVSYAPYGDSVFVVETGDGGVRTVRQSFVKLAGTRGDQVAVAEGVSPGDEVVSSGVFKLRQGAAVRVQNEVQPGNDPAPRPEDN